MAERKYYVFCEDNCKFEGMTKEQTMSAIMQAVNDGSISNVDAGFVTKLKELNKQGNIQFWIGTMAEFEKLPQKDNNVLYMFTDDPTLTEIETAFDTINKQIDGLGKTKENIISGVQKVGKAEEATNSKAVNNVAITQDSNGVLKIGDTIIPQKVNILKKTLVIPSESGEVTSTQEEYLTETKNFKNGQLFEIHGTDDIKITHFIGLGRYLSNNGYLQASMCSSNSTNISFSIMTVQLFVGNTSNNLKVICHNVGLKKGEEIKNKSRQLNITAIYKIIE